MPASQPVYDDGVLRISRTLRPPGAAVGRLVQLHDVPPQLRAVLEIIGWDSIPGLAVTGPG